MGGVRAWWIDLLRSLLWIQTNRLRLFGKRLREMIAEFQAKGFSPRQIARELRGASEGI